MPKEKRGKKMNSQVIRTEQITVTEEEYQVIKDFCEALKDYVYEIHDDSDYLDEIINTLGTYYHKEEERIKRLAEIDFKIVVKETEEGA